MKNYENVKVELIGLTDEHIRMFLQTFADIGTEKYAPNIEVKAIVKEK